MREIIKKLIKEERRQWTKDEVLNLAKNYTQMNHFKKNEPRAYGAARNNGWLDDVRKFMTPKYFSWDDDTIFQEASKYEFLKDFREKSPQAFAAAKHRNLIPKLQLKNTPSNSPTLSPEEVKKESEKYDNRKDFRTQSPLAYRWAIHYDLFGKTITHLGDTQDRNPAGFWDYEKLKAEAFKYKTKKEFTEKNSGAVSTAKKMGIWDEITSHMETLGNLTERAVYAWEFPDKTVYVGLTYNLEMRGIQHLDPEGKTQVSKYLKKTQTVPIFKLISDYVPESEAANLENCSIEDYKSKGWEILNKKKGGGLGSCRRIWTYDKLKQEAEKYNNVSDFKKYSYSAYVSAQKYGYFNELTKNMIRKNRKNIQ